MIQSGSSTPGISAEDFRLPPHTALRYERPAPALADHLLSYAVLDSEPGRHGVAWMLPGWAQIWIVIDAGDITVQFGSRRAAPLPAAALYGVTSRAMRVTSNCGVSIAIDVSPLGWARLFAARADELRDRMVPLQHHMDPELVAELTLAIHRSDHCLEVKDVLDAFFLRRMATPHPDEARIATIMALIGDRSTRDLAEAAAACGIPLPTLRRLSKRYFGFPPKLLMMRTRFLASFIAMMARGGTPDYGRISPAYHDVPHFIRDAQRFLGMTPRQFMAIDTPYLYAALRARRLVLGTETPSLDAAAPPEERAAA